MLTFDIYETWYEDQEGKLYETKQFDNLIQAEEYCCQLTEDNECYMYVPIMRK